jgi:hypothetical protein
LSKPLWKPGLALLAVAQFFAWSMPIQSFARQPGKRTEPAASASPIQVTADFSVPEGYPLVKDKIGVYQTPFMGIHGRPPLIAMEKLLRLAGVQDLRYELAWGKSDTYAYSQVSGTASQPTIDFAPLDPFLRMLMRTASIPCWPSPTILFRCRLVLLNGRPDVGVHRRRRRMDGRKY